MRRRREGTPVLLWQRRTLGVARLHHRRISLLKIGWRHPPYSQAPNPSTLPLSLSSSVALRHVSRPFNQFKSARWRNVKATRATVANEQEADTGRAERTDIREGLFSSRRTSSDPIRTLTALTGRLEICFPWRRTGVFERVCEGQRGGVVALWSRWEAQRAGVSVRSVPGHCENFRACFCVKI